MSARLGAGTRARTGYRTGVLSGFGGWHDDGVMEMTPQSRSDLYKGTARDYHSYRVPYPATLIDDLAVRAALSGTGRLLDLACGPGRLTFALSKHFADVLAIDQEEESVSYAKALAAERGDPHIDGRPAEPKTSMCRATLSW